MTKSLLSLDEIGLRTGTDKASVGHGYLDFYERFFEKLRDKPIKILEIGVLGGASVKMWAQYFLSGTVVGADIDPTVIRFSSDRILIEIIDQSNLQNLVDLGVKHGPFDIIVEDGSHLWEHQITSLRALFPFLKDGGFYIIEDLQTNFGGMADGYRGVANISCVEYLKKWVDLRVATSLIDISNEEDAFLRTYGRSAGFLAFYKHACLIEKKIDQQDNLSLIKKDPLIKIDPAAPIFFKIHAHIGFVGDVEDNGSASLSAKPIKDHYIQGFNLSSMVESASQIRYRGRQADGSWTNWVSGSQFVGSRGKANPLTGYSIEISGKVKDDYNISVVGVFFDSDDIIIVGNGEECIPAQDGAFLRGMQLALSPKARTP